MLYARVARLEANESRIIVFKYAKETHHCGITSTSPRCKRAAFWPILLYIMNSQTILHMKPHSINHSFKKTAIKIKYQKKYLKLTLKIQIIIKINITDNTVI